ncbi:fungal-specific transcription factor domain-containing protein [Xylogone sp. PMI_703]|nr:fungal-specific transcription factor domain-containing protein [Xylogone sp. PMI_703]
MMDGRQNSEDGERADEAIVAKGEDSKADDALFSNNRKRQGPRKRVSQACDKCRTRKDKCDGQKPVCSNCATHGRDCTYEANVKKRGLPEGYVRGMEKLWGLTLREVKGVEDSILLILTGDEGTLVRIWNDDGQSENLVDGWRKSQISRELERLLPVLDSGADATKRKRADPEESQAEKRLAIGETRIGVQYSTTDSGAHIISSLVPKEQDARRLSKSQPISPLAPNEADRIQQGIQNQPVVRTNGVNSNGIAQGSTYPVLPSDTWQLLDIYFSYTHCWLPIVEKHHLLRTSHQYSQHSADPSNLSAGDMAALFAALTYAKYQSFGVIIAPGADTASERQSVVDEMYAQAKLLIPDELGSYEVGHIQALLILSLTNMGLGRLSAAWYLIGQAVRISLDLGLDHRGSQNSRSETRGKNVFLGCFVLDTIISARLARPPHLTSSSVNQVGYVDEDGLEEWDPWTDCLNIRANSWNTIRGPGTILSTFNRLLKVLQFLNDCICSSKRSRNPQVALEITERLKKLDLYQSPPFRNEVQATGDPRTPILFPHHYHLRMTYFNALATSQLLSHHQSKVGSNLEPCVNSARGISDLLVRSTEAYGSAMKPPTFEYFMKTAYDVVDAVRGSIENTHIALDDWKQDLDNCLDAMDPSWPAFGLLKSSCSYQPKSQGRRESEVAFELISGGLSQAADTPQSQITQSSSRNYGAMSPWNQFQHTTATPPKSARPAESITTHNQPPVIAGQPTSERKQSMALSPGSSTPFDSQKGQASPFIAEIPNVQEIWSMANRSQVPLKTSTPTENPRQPSVSAQSTIQKGAEVDNESMFNEFAALDAMQWTDNWDQSLVNLGFTNADNMNQDFYAFCREPDPLYPNTLFRQLLANEPQNNQLDRRMPSNETGRNSFSALHSTDENEALEAGQLLQALGARGRSNT